MGKQKVKPLHSLTKLEAEKQSLSLAGELAEEIDATGGESEKKAAKWVIEKGEVERKNAWNKKARLLENLNKKNRHKIVDYRRTLAEIMTHYALSEEYPKDWDWHVAITDKGILMLFNSPDQRQFARAFTPTHLPEYDLVAITKVLESGWQCIQAWKEANGRKQIQTSFN